MSMEQQQLTELSVAGNGIDSFVVDDLLDFSNNDDDGRTDGGFDAVLVSSHVSASTVADSCSSSGCDPSFADGADFSGDLCVPCDDLAELEWLSHFVEDSFSNEHQDKLYSFSGFDNPQPNGSTQTRPGAGNVSYNINNENDDVPFPAKARSKRSRAAVSTWTSSALISGKLPEPCSPPGPGHITDVSSFKKKRRENDAGGSGGVRRCVHCEAEKTPQWRTGPMGPKTLCNACGVRYKSGRLVPEYRPAASPTFLLTKHSNSHRKVLEIRRQKDSVVLQQPQMDQAEFPSQLRRERVLMGVHHHVGPRSG